VIRDAIRTYLSDYESQILLDGEIISTLRSISSISFDGAV
jgi:hypothetical protein